ncbi:HipA domain-containing protein [Oligoflexus tunisiensis]|uniref:HipA domain-containing protein n=1 Tax=Oligoflexus tunisiensis TaxID=708132 RepID=UPI00114C8B73
MYNFDRRGWDLSPAFDINPVLGGVGLTLSIDEGDCSLSLECARSVAPYFQIERTEADDVIQHVLAVRKGWRMQAKKVGIKPSEIELMSSVFEADR